MYGRMELSFGSALVLLVEVAVALAALLQRAGAQTTHVVGDSLGWTLSPDGAGTYSNWASSQTFIVGDILVFNFTTGVHDVAKVSKTSFDACDGTSTIGFVMNTGPARIILRSIGEQYFICTFIGHCSFGQKLAIKVTAASATTNPPASSPSISSVPAITPSIAPILANPPSMNVSPILAPTLSIAPGPANPPAATIASPPSVISPSSSPPSVISPLSSMLAPTMARVPATYVVGDSLGWTIPLGGSLSYATWATSKTFIVGDTLLFKFTAGEHDVAEVSKAGFDACDGTSTIGSVINTSPARITISSIGEHYFICSFVGHCSFGQKLAIKVTAASAPANPPAYSPQIFTSPTIAMTPKVSIAPTPANLTTSFPPSMFAPGPANPPGRTASPPSISPSPMLAPMPSTAVGPANGMASPPSMNLSPILAPSLSGVLGPANPPTLIASPPSISPSSMLAPTVVRAPATYVVGDSLGWTIPLGGPVTYATWATGKTFMVGDTLLFDFQTGQHDVAEVPKLGFDACDASTTIGTTLNAGPASITLKSPGEHFFICTFSTHCSFGQKLAINVAADPTAATPPPMGALAPSISHSPATPPIYAPSSSSTPSSTPPTSGASPSPATLPTVALSPSLTPPPGASVSSSTSPGTSPTSAASPPSTTPSPALAPTHSRAPETQTVGDSSGWTLPPGGPSVYATWASRKTFAVGDTLLFNFATGQHDVAEVSKSGFDGCNKASIIGSHIETGPATITLKSPGEHYFICTYEGHCQVGQKLAVNVLTVAIATPSSSNSSSIAVSPSLLATAPSEMPSSASSLTIAGFSITSVTIFASFFLLDNIL